MTERTLLCAIFGAVVLVMMALDLCVFPHRPNLLTALIWSGVWIGLAMVFMGLVCWWQGPRTALKLLTGYVIEESLRVDSLFVFLLLFSCFRVSPEHQHGVLFCGILGAMIFWRIFVVAGVALIHRFACVIYLFRALLVVSGLKMAFRKDGTFNLEETLSFVCFEAWRRSRSRTKAAGSSSDETDAHSPHLCSLFCWRSRRRTSSSRWTQCRPRWRSRLTRSSCIHPTCLRSWGCAPYISCWQDLRSCSIPCVTDFRQFWSLSESK
jgi:hypothetical protein